MLRIYKTLILLVTLSFAVACAPSKGFKVATHGPEAKTKELEDRKTTGLEEVVKVEGTSGYRIIKYTPSGDLDSYEKFAKNERRSAKHSPELSQLIEDAKVSQVINGDNHEFEIKIHLKKQTTTLEFKYSVNRDDILKVTSTNSTTNLNNGFTYKLTALCENVACSILNLNLLQLKDEKIDSQAGIFYTVTNSKVKAVFAGDKAPADNPFLDKLQQQTSAVKQTFTIVDGTSSATISFVDPDDTNKNLIEIKTPIGQTNDSPIAAQDITLGSESNNEVIGANLQGSNAELGSLAFELELARIGQENVSKLRLYLDNATESLPTPNPDFDFSPSESALANYKNPVFPLAVDKNNRPVLSNTFLATTRLEHYRSHKTTRKYIDMWTQDESSKIGFCNQQTYYSPSRAKKFFAQMSSKIKGSTEQKETSLGQLTASILNKIDTMPQMAYLAILESNYVDNYDANIVVNYNKKAGQALSQGDKRYKYWSDASGPYGCLTDTCRAIIRNNKQLLDNAGLDIQVSYVTEMERGMYNQKVQQGVKESDIRRGDFRKAIFNSGQEASYAKQRANGADLLDTDARKYFATATLLAGLEIRRLLNEKKKYTHSEGSNLPKNTQYVKEMRKDPALAILAYHSGYNALARYAICSQLSSESERKSCLKTTSKNKAENERHKGFNTTFADITKYEMAPCNQLDYTWAWLAIQFIGSNPELYNIPVGTPSKEGLTYKSLFPDNIQLSGILDGHFG